MSYCWLCFQCQLWVSYLVSSIRVLVRVVLFCQFAVSLHGGTLKKKRRFCEPSCVSALSSGG